MSNTQYLVVVLVAKRLASSVKDVPDPDIRPEAVDVNSGIKRQRIAVDVCAVDGGGAYSRVLVLPDAEVAVNEAMVKPENLVVVREELGQMFVGRTYWVGRCGVDILHNGANTVVAPGVSSALRAASHVGKSGPRVAGIDHRLTGINGLSTITITGKAMRLVA